MTSQIKLGARAVSVLVVATLIAGCSGGESQAGNAQTVGAERDLFEQMLQTRSHLALRDRGYVDLADLVASKVDESGKAKRSIEGLVRGRIVGVEPLAGYYPGAGEEEASSRSVGYSDPRAVWQSVSLSVAVDETLLGPRASTVDVRMVVYPSQTLDDLRRVLASYGEVAIFLEAPPMKFGDEPRLPVILDDAETLIDISPDGSLTLPFVEDEMESELLGEISAFEDLRTAALSAER